jgi:radical SAM protein with 4Fe4S-binding SPASM domain
VPYQNKYLVLSPDCVLKRLEDPCVYNVTTDELYETNEEAFEFLKLCDGSYKIAGLKYEEDFVEWCLKEGLLKLTSRASKRDFSLENAPRPSLRYLEIQITARCNLKCRHCYLGEARQIDMPVSTALAAFEEFERMQGLRLLISGGEPLLHPDIWSINDLLPRFGFRSILMTNGTLVDRPTAEKLNVHEVQISLDGLEHSHDILRGRGTFNKAINAINELRRLGKDVSVATMVHAYNLNDFQELKALIEEMGIKEWNVDVPSTTGKLAENKELQVPYHEAAHLLEYSFGGGLYTSSPGYACGAHLCTVMPDGDVAKCGFFSKYPVGNIRDGLRSCWKRITHITLKELECRCSFIKDCRGGCRFRAMVEKDIYSPDPIQCYLRGVLKNT